jgi:tryptophan-rich sensory protein
MRFRTPVQIFSLLFGILYVLAGLAGFLVTGFRGFVETSGETLIVFGLNPLHNIVHMLIGGAWIAASTSESSARTVSLAIGLTLGLVAVLGFVGALRFLAIDSLADPDNFLHLVTAALALYFGSVGAEPGRVQGG